ncbi:MAG: hypothetical protein B6I19_00795 [Bacteroidetes bacterium 4572_114]|nr:MAG: hypothetical protein B6I19_00795 [Bacteroidetes bacterium 4572_114]
MRQLQTNILLIIILLLAKPVISQDVKADAKLDTNVILVGDQIGFRIELALPENYNFSWPVFDDTLTGDIEIVKKSKVDTTATNNGLMNIRQDFTITSFDSGYYLIPPISFKYGIAGGTLSDQVETEPYLLNVFTVEVDTTKSFMPIKGPMEAPYTFAEIFPWILLAIAILLIAGLTIYFLVKKEKNIPLFAPRPKPKLPPHTVALDALDKLKNEKLWQQGHVKKYHTRLTEIVRIYIEDSMEVRAVEMTSPEILGAIGQTGLDKKDIGPLKEILELADLVKFAKFKPQPSENGDSLERAYDFVKRTMKKQEVIEGEKPEVQDKQETKEGSSDNDDIPTSPFVKNISSGINIPADLDSKSEYSKYLAEKYKSQ